MPDSPADLADLVEFWAARRPDEVAVRYGDQAWTWAQWQDRVARNAGAQLALGLRPGDRVAFLDKNHPACIETTLACARAGTANAVVNFRLAAEEIAFVVDDAQATVLFAGPEFLPVVEQIRDRIPTVRQVIEVGEPYERLLADAEPAPARPYLRGDCFLQLYTSGTTGFPKGAMLTHEGMTAHSLAVREDSDLGPDCVGMVAMPLFHVGGTSWALAALFAGSSIVVVRDIVPNLLLAEMVATGTTHSFFVPAVFAFLLQVPDAAQRDWSKLRTLVYGASPMPLPLLRRSLEVFPCGFRQVYGMTEAGGVVTALGPDEHRDPAREHLLVSAGKPIPGVEVKVVAPGTAEVTDVGEVGEVLVRTRQLMSGYWRRDAAEQSVDADGWLHSGDAGHLDAEGYLFVSDRIKDMIISGGENIYPAEIERVLAEHPAVADVAVIGVPDERWGEVPHAIVVVAPGAAVDEETLIAYCLEHLASFKCPKSVQVMTELPRNPTGKILKRQLREPFWAGHERVL